MTIVEYKDKSNVEIIIVRGDVMDHSSIAGEYTNLRSYFY